MFGTWFGTRQARKRKRKLDIERFNARAERLEATLAEERERERAIRRAESPTTAEVYQQAVELGPLLLLVSPNTPPPVRGAALLAIASTTLAGLLVNHWLRRAAREVLLWPLAIVVFALGATRSGWLAFWRGAIIWRDTRYSVASLRAGRRVRFP